MQIQVTVDDELMRKALAASDQPTATAVIDEALRILVCLSSQTKLEDMFGMFPDGFVRTDRS